MTPLYTTNLSVPQPSESKEHLIAEYIEVDYQKFIALNFLRDTIISDNHRNVLSIGAGPCVFEHFLKSLLPDCSISAIDYNEMLMEQAGRYFPEIDTYHADMKHLDREPGCYDIAYFLNSSYVMTNEEYVVLLKKLHDAGVKTIVDFTTAIIPWYNIPETTLRSVLPQKGKMHGYCRTTREFERIYTLAGWSIKDERELGCYYVWVVK